MKTCYYFLNFSPQQIQNQIPSGATMTTNRQFISIAIFCTAFTLQTAHAEQALAPVTTPDQFVIQLPVVGHEALIEQVGKVRSQLIQRKQELVQSVADKKLDRSDAIITAIIPGGLLYAGYKKARYEQTKNELARVSADIEEFSGDLLALQSTPAQLVVAQPGGHRDPNYLCRVIDQRRPR